jgi:large-conductance mechanosensitive channel
MFDALLNNTQFFQELKKFITDNGIIGTTSGVIIAVSTKDMIASLVADVIVPVILYICLKLNFKWIDYVLPTGNAGINLTNFSKMFITWVITLIMTFYFLKATFQSFLGLSIYKQETKENK